jgi:hypothetical protein
LLFLLIGPIAWALHLTAMYASHTIVCAFRTGPIFAIEPMHAIAAIAAFVALALIAAAICAPETICRSLGLKFGVDWPFYRKTAALLAVLSAAGVAWAAVTVFFIPACTALR